MTVVLREWYWAAYAKFCYYFTGSYTHQVVLASWDLFAQLWPYLVLAIVLTALLATCWRREDMAAFLRRSPRRSVWTATFVGIVSPVPTYVAIPLVAALFRAGVPAPPLFAFLVASPLMNPMIFSLTVGAFGYEMAILRAASAVTLGLLAAWVAESRAFADCFARFACADTGPSGHGGRGGTPPRPGAAWEFARQLRSNSRFILKYFTAGVIVAAAVKVLVPTGWIVKTLGAGSSLSVLLAVAAGVPLYACGGGTIPVLQTLQQMGMDKGAILAFFISGPATKLSTLVALKAAVDYRVFLLYLAIGLVGATAFGFAYSLW
jgi:uncharacterized membrane protein YraQ (UPF0718 family)